jgi:hypothetical protein
VWCRVPHGAGQFTHYVFPVTVDLGAALQSGGAYVSMRSGATSIGGQLRAAGEWPGLALCSMPMAHDTGHGACGVL